MLDTDTSTARYTTANTNTTPPDALPACGNTSGRVHQTIMVVDDQPPTIGGQGNDGTAECPATASFTPPTASATSSTSSVALGIDTSTARCGPTYSEPPSSHAFAARSNSR